jgi:hypothetical protein
VVAHNDPGVYNWLDTTGLEQGVLILRLCGATRAQPPKTRVISLTDVAAVLPTAMRCGADERRTQLAERREGVSRLIVD